MHVLSRPYDEEMADGLQILRYNVSKAYIPYVATA